MEEPVTKPLVVAGFSITIATDRKEPTNGI